MEEHNKKRLLDSAGPTNFVGGLLILVGCIGIFCAFVFAAITLNSMTNTSNIFDSSLDVAYSTSQRFIAVSTVGFGVGIPSLLLVGVGRLLQVSAVWFEAIGEKPLQSRTRPTPDAGTV